MARHPDWFARLDTIVGIVRQADKLEWLGRKEIKAIFGCSERDSIRLLHKFGAGDRENALCLTRSALQAQLEAIQAGSTYAAFLRHRQDVAGQLTAARVENTARQLRVRPAAPEKPLRLEDLPKTITWRRDAAGGPGRFEILYADGADLMSQLVEFLGAASMNRERFFLETEPSDDDSR
jgi:hypothetical protein